MELSLSPADRAAVDDLRPDGYPHRAFLDSLSSPVALHYFATRYNVNDGSEPLLHLVRHPDCDRGTAVAVYWLSEPVDLYASAERDGLHAQVWQLMKTIERAVETGAYRHQHIRFSPQEYIGRVAMYKLKKGNSPIPAALLADSPGVIAWDAVR